MIDMLELAKKLIPDIEENMPAAVREAFEAGKVKSIFRTGGKDINPKTGKRFMVARFTAVIVHHLLTSYWTMDALPDMELTTRMPSTKAGRVGDGWVLELVFLK